MCCSVSDQGCTASGMCGLFGAAGRAARHWPFVASALLFADVDARPAGPAAVFWRWSAAWRGSSRGVLVVLTGSILLLSLSSRAFILSPRLRRVQDFLMCLFLRIAAMMSGLSIDC